MYRLLIRGKWLCVDNHQPAWGREIFVAFAAIPACLSGVLGMIQLNRLFLLVFAMCISSWNVRRWWCVSKEERRANWFCIRLIACVCFFCIPLNELFTGRTNSQEVRKCRKKAPKTKEDYSQRSMLQSNILFIPSVAKSFVRISIAKWYGQVLRSLIAASLPA